MATILLGTGSAQCYSGSAEPAIIPRSPRGTIRVATPLSGAIRVQLRGYAVDSRNAVDAITPRSGTR
jgi:hypothetical protein